MNAKNLYVTVGLRGVCVGFVLVLLLGAFPASAEYGGWQYLFNGKDLEGWKANRAADSFSVRDGVLVAHSTDARSHLFFVGKDEVGDLFKNFELVTVVRGEAKSNSGIFFHTDLALRDAIGHLGSGYEVQLNSDSSKKHATGSLYDVADIETSVVDESKWFELRIRVEGKRIRVWVDGEPTVDYTEPAKPVRKESRKDRLLRAEGGAIALQAHDPASTFYFREIRVLRLPDGDSARVK